MINLVPPQETTTRFDIYLGDMHVFSALKRVTAEQVMKALRKSAASTGGNTKFLIQKVTTPWFFGMGGPWPVEARWSVSALEGKLVWGWATSPEWKEWTRLGLLYLPIKYKGRLISARLYD